MYLEFMIFRIFSSKHQKMIWFYPKWLQYLELTVYDEHLGRMIANDQIRNTSLKNRMDNAKEKNIKKNIVFSIQTKELYLRDVRHEMIRSCRSKMSFEVCIGSNRYEKYYRNLVLD